MTKNGKKRWAITLNSDTKLESLTEVLPKNEDTFKLAIKQMKEPFKVGSKETFI